MPPIRMATPLDPHPMNTLFRPLLVALLTASFLAIAPANGTAQTTHVVQLFTMSFSPAQIVIQPGDTVRWTWVVGGHDVKSGVTGIPNGIFNSGNPVVAPNTFQVTFDAAFLQANPMPGNVYDYYCQLHIPAMKGRITVQSPTYFGGFTAFGTALNPAQSLVVLSGAPVVGGTFALGVQNPLDAAAPAGFAFLSLALAPDANYPLGTPLPNLGLGGPGVQTYVLLSTVGGGILGTLGPVGWGGGGTPPAPFGFTVPNVPALAGKGLYLQGAIYTPSTFRLGLTNGLQVVIGS